jgi:hypothetical protein
MYLIFHILCQDIHHAHCPMSLISRLSFAFTDSIGVSPGYCFVVNGSNPAVDDSFHYFYVAAFQTNVTTSKKQKEVELPLHWCHGPCTSIYENVLFSRIVKSGHIVSATDCYHTSNGTCLETTTRRISNTLESTAFLGAQVNFRLCLFTNNNVVSTWKDI